MKELTVCIQNEYEGNVIYRTELYTEEEYKQLEEENKKLNEEIENHKQNIMQDELEIIPKLEEENKKLKEENKILKELIRGYFNEDKKVVRMDTSCMEEDTLQELRDLGEI